ISHSPFSPVRDFHHHRTASTANRGFFFSGPITPLLPTAASRARRRTKNAVVFAEPTSPKVSCIGQIKLANKSKCPETKTRERKNLKTASSRLVKEAGKGNWSKLKRLFSMGSRKSNYVAVSAASEPPISAVEAVAAPSLCKMKKFASSREALGGFDWTAEIKRYSSDDKETMIPCAVSTPLAMCSRQKSEVNLWKRRTMDQPKPLQVKASY
ncbi:BnaAnng39270D, partial [Brassica napus]